MEDWEFKNILDQSLYEHEQREKGNRISRQIETNRKASAPMSLQGWIRAIIVFLILSAIIPTGYAILMLIASALGLF